MAIAKKPVVKKTTTAPRKTTTKSEKPKTGMVAKSITLIVSIGDEDRDRVIEDFQRDVMEAIKKTKGGVKRVVPAGAYYIIDGKTCLPADYDPVAQDFLPGKTPPPWAGGPSPVKLVESPAKYKPVEPHRISREEADRRIAVGIARTTKATDDDDYEEIEWSPEDATDNAKMEKVAEESTAKATVKKKVVVKKPASAKPAPAKKTAAAPSRRRRTV